jgi:uracil-DNA glycosylase
MQFSFSEVHPSWENFFNKHLDQVEAILSDLSSSDFTPSGENLFRSFRQPVDRIQVVIFGQDPYPGEGVADGLAFSSPAGNAIPASLRNIFSEYSTDLSLPIPTSPDLSLWSERGVMLLNRTLTTAVGERNAHLGLQWKEFTFSVAHFLGERSVVAILWGNYAKELASLFEYFIESAHPSPLSAYRGFFGSKPFSRCNQILLKKGEKPIDWKLE